MWLGVLFVLQCVAATVAVNATHIVIGQTITLSGSAASTGNRSGFGFRAAFQEANDAGGVNSRNVTLVALDDQGQTAMALSNVAILNTTHNALLIAGTYGNAPFATVLPMLAQFGIPLVGPISGLPNTHHPFQEVVVNVRPSFSDEAVALARFLVEFLRVQRIACMYTNDDLGLGAYATLVDALDSVGLSLVVSAIFAKDVAVPNMTLPMEAILGAKQKPQSVVLICLEVDIAQFITTFRQDPRGDPNCSFIFLSVSSATSLSVRLGPKYWHNVYFSRTVPMPDADYDLSRRFTQVAAKYIPADLLTDQLTFESYIVGRFIIEVLKGINNFRLHRKGFLDAVYNAHLFYLDDISLGLYGRNFSGCQDSICSCNSGMRRVYIATFNPVSGRTVSNANFPITQYPLTQCAASHNLIRRPILFGQLVPTDDPVTYNIAQNINAGLKFIFANVNAAGGLNGRQYDVISAEYSGDPANATAALVDRWPVVALVGSVVTNGMSLPTSFPRIGTFDLTPRPAEPQFDMEDIRVLATTPMEMMALTSFLVEHLGTTAHFRVRRSANSAALLDTLTKSINTFQGVPASSAEFDSAVAAFAGLTTGYVLAIGNSADMVAWVRMLQERPGLTLLTIKQCVTLLLGTGFTDTNSSIVDQVLFPLAVQASTSSGSYSMSFSMAYGYNVGTLLTKVMGQSPAILSTSYTTPANVVKAWYDVQVLKLENMVVGPYYAANCTIGGDSQCECNLGCRSLAIVNLATKASYRYESTTCHVQFKPLQLSAPSPSNFAMLSVVLGVVLGMAFALAMAAWVVVRGKRNNRAAPKDASQPFCIIFTDIQASTSLWATIPNYMAPALDVHHHLVRKLIRKYNCYEVKTIGDSFMCATTSPTQALRFALAVQETFHQHDWGTTAIDDAYDSLVTEVRKTPECWNGLRVRVGIHFGHGNIKLDPVSRGYDYYGTVVNTAARIESVCHGGQIGVSEAVYRAAGGRIAGSVWTSLGPQVLRGLSDPIFLYQVLPEGLLARRRFPPLRIDRVDAREGVLEDDRIENDGNVGRTDWIPNLLNRSISPSSRSSSCNEMKWIEVHPLLQRGETTAEELRLHYAILQTGLRTLLATQTKLAKAQMLKQLCERLHIPNYGAEGQQFLNTLHGLISRLLPATISQQAARRGSVHSKVSSSTPFQTAAHALPTPSVHSRHTRSDSPSQTFAVSPHHGSKEDVRDLLP